MGDSGRLAVGRVLHRYDHPNRPDHGLLPAFPAHWLLVTPRDYLSTLMKIGTLVLLVIGIIIANPSVKVPDLTELASTSTGPTFSGNLFPFLFITIACGALSGFHGAVSSVSGLR